MNSVALAASVAPFEERVWSWLGLVNVTGEGLESENNVLTNASLGNRKFIHPQPCRWYGRTFVAVGYTLFTSVIRSAMIPLGHETSEEALYISNEDGLPTKNVDPLQYKFPGLVPRCSGRYLA